MAFSGKSGYDSLNIPTFATFTDPMQSPPTSNIYTRFALQFALLLGVYQGIRFLFFCINHAYFQDVDLPHYLGLVLHSLRFDLSTVFSVNLLYLVLSLLPVAIVGESDSMYVC